MRAVFLPIVTLFLLSSLSACESDSDSSSSSVDASSPQAFIDSYVDILCSAVGSCCAEKGYDGSGMQCKAFAKMSFTPEKLKPNYDPAKGKKCLDEMQAFVQASYSCTNGASNKQGPDSSCTEVLLGGDKALGEPCKEDDDCAASTDPNTKVECYQTTTSSEGKSQDITYCRAIKSGGKEGEGPCLITVDGDMSSSFGSGQKTTEGVSCDVAEGLYCPSAKDDKQSPVCTRILNEGEACTFSDRCGKDLDCNDNKCTSRAKVGEPCDFSCVEAAYCDKSTKKCAAKKAAGMACESFEECEGSCSNSVCEKSGSLEDFGLMMLCGAKK